MDIWALGLTVLQMYTVKYPRSEELKGLEGGKLIKALCSPISLPKSLPKSMVDFLESTFKFENRIHFRIGDFFDNNCFRTLSKRITNRILFI